MKIKAIHKDTLCCFMHVNKAPLGAQWLSGRVLDSRPKGRGFEPHRRHCVVSLSKNINPSLVLVQPRKTRPFITERLLMGRKESNQTKTKPHILGKWPDLSPKDIFLQVYPSQKTEENHRLRQFACRHTSGK